MMNNDIILLSQATTTVTNRWLGRPLAYRKLYNINKCVIFRDIKPMIVNRSHVMVIGTSAHRAFSLSTHTHTHTRICVYLCVERYYMAEC